MPFRRPDAAALLQATLDANKGDCEARRWLHPDQARSWADLVDLPEWPPRLDQLGNKATLA
jgi:hypothetical protein